MKYHFKPISIAVFSIATSVLFAGMLNAKSLVYSGNKLELSGYNIKITDGDTIRAGDYRLRMLYIDAPEIKQECYTFSGKAWDCGVKSKERLMKLVGDGKKVECDISGKDKYSRNLAVCYNADVNINKQMVVDGYAMAYVNYGSPYVLEQEQARNNKLGIWSGTFLDPQVYRKLQKQPKESKQLTGKGKGNARNKGYTKSRKEL